MPVSVLSICYIERGNESHLLPDLSYIRAGLTELCADFSEIMRNFFPNYAVKIANYAGIMRIAQYLL